MNSAPENALLPITRNRPLDSWLLMLQIRRSDSHRARAAGFGKAANFGEVVGGQGRRERTVEESPASRTEAQFAIDQRRGTLRCESIEVAAILAADFNQVLEAGVGEKCDTRAFFLKQGVGRDGRTISDDIGDLVAE